MSTVGKGQTVSVHYIGTFEDGTQFDNSYDRGDALSFEVGSGQMIKGFDAALPGMTVGEKKEITIPSVDAYGDVVTESFQAAPFTSFPEDFDFVVGNTVYGKTGEGQDFSARIHEVGDDSVMLDFNHPLAGKSLTFEIELVSID